MQQLEQKCQTYEDKINDVYHIFDLEKKIPDLAMIFDTLKYMTPLMREKLVEYLSYYGIAMAQDSLEEENRDMIKGWFAVVLKLKQVFEQLKLSQVKQE